MGEFDDVMAMEPSDDWDLPADDGSDANESLPETVAVLRLPGAFVELRGDVPDELVDRLEPLRDERLHVDEPLIVPVVVTHEGASWTVSGPDGAFPVDGSRVDDLEAVVSRHLDSITVATDPARLHLAVSCTEFDGVGIVLGSERPEDRAAIAAELVRLGGGVVTERILTLLPGSHTVFGYPAPAPASPAGTAVVPFTTVDVVAFVHRAPGAPTIMPLPTAESCIRLLGATVDRERFGPAVLDVIASIATNATHWELGHDDAVAGAQLVRSLGPPPRRAFCVVHRFDEDTGTRPTVDRDAASLRVARFDDGAVALDAATDKVLELTGDEIDALEELLVVPSRDRPTPLSSDPRFGRLIAHGMFVPDAHGRRPVPGTEAFGLPNCPSGDTARSMWSEVAEGGAERISGQVAGARDGSNALAVLRGVVHVDDDQRRDAVEVHRRVQDEVVGVERRLLATIALLGDIGIEPLVLGSVVNAHDGPLPPYFAESEQVDLLVHDGQLADAVEALERAGHTRIGLAVSGDGDTHGVVDLRQPDDDVPVRVRDTLAVGPFGALVDHEEFHRRSVPVRIHGRWCRSLHPEHRFVHACVQLELDAGEPSMQLVRDVVLAAPRADALMAEAMEASERWGATATVTAAVRRVDTLLPGLPPWIVERSTRREAGPSRNRGGVLGRRSRKAERSRR